MEKSLPRVRAGARRGHVDLNELRQKIASIAESLRIEDKQ